MACERRDVKLYSLLDALQLHKGRAGCVLEYMLWFYLFWVCRERGVDVSASSREPQLLALPSHLTPHAHHNLKLCFSIKFPSSINTPRSSQRLTASEHLSGQGRGTLLTLEAAS